MEFPKWEMHAQTTFVYQGYPGFRALYSGENSLSPRAQAKEIWSASAFLGFRLWEGGELYYNPDLLQGFGLSDTVGVGGYPNGEAQKSGFFLPRYNTTRMFLRQTFGLGGEQEKVEGAAEPAFRYARRLAADVSSRQVSRQGSVRRQHLFQRSRTNFMNSSIWASGAFDCGADKVGLTYGRSPS